MGFGQSISLHSWRDSGAGERAALMASLPKQKHSRAKSRQLRRLAKHQLRKTILDLDDMTVQALLHWYMFSRVFV